MIIHMDEAVKGGIVFGLTTGIITTLGLTVGLYSGTHSKLAIIGAIVTIAVCGALSDSLGMRFSEESENKRKKYIRESEVSTFLSQLIFSLTFVIPFLLLQLRTAIVVSIIWGLLWMGVFSFFIAKQRKKNPVKIIANHLLIAVVVIIITHYIGYWISQTFI